MARMLAVSFAAAVVCSVAILGAQGSGKGAGVKGGSTIPITPTITVAGCVKLIATDTHQAGSADHPYMLVDAQVGGSGNKTTYMISGLLPPGVNLANNLDQRIELTGSMVDPVKGSTMPQFNVTGGFKMIARTC